MFTVLSRYAPPLVSNPRDEMSSSVTCFVDLVNEVCRMTMLHSNMNFSSLVVYYQSIEVSRLGKVSRNLKMSGSNDQNQPRFKRRSPI